MDDLERAVLCEFNQQLKTSNPQLYQSARQYLEQIALHHHEILKVCVDKVLKNQSRHEVLFWCFQTLTNSIIMKPQVIHSLTQQEIQGLQQALVLYIRDVCSKDASLPAFVVNKFVECLVQLFRVTYLECWPDFWRLIFSTLQLGETSDQKERIVTVYLKILDTIDEKIVSRSIHRERNEHQHNVQIKDKMRDDCITDVVNTWYTILMSQHKELTKRCLTTMSNYIDWIDINLIANERYMKLIFSYVSSPDFREEACDCLCVIVAKGMPPIDKLQLLLGLQLPSIRNMNVNSETEEVFATKIAQLTSAISLELLACWDKLTTTNEDWAMKAYATLQDFLPFVFKIFGDQDDDVSSKMIEFMDAYMQQLKKKQKISALTDREHMELRSMIDIVARKAKFTEDFIFNPLQQQEYEVNFLEYRIDMFGIFKNVARLTPNIARQYIESELTKTLATFRQNNKAFVFWDIEIILSLFYQLGEVFSREATDPTLDAGYFRNLFAEIITSGVSFYPHESVQLAYFEIINRYCNLLSAQQNLIIPVLESFVDARGMRNPNGVVHSRTTFVFLKLVKTLERFLHQFVDKLYEFLHELLRVDQDERTDILGENKLFLYEALGSILSYDQVSAQSRLSILDRLLKPIIFIIEEIVNKQLYNTDTPDNPKYCKMLADHIQIVSHLFKGLSSHKTAPEVKELFRNVLKVIANVSQILPRNRLIAEKIVLFFRIMMSVLSDEAAEVFPAILAQLFSVATDTYQMKEILVLMVHLVTKKQAAVFNTVNEMFLPIIGKVFQMIDSGNYDQTSVSEDTRQKMELHKMYFQLVDSILQHNLSQVFTSSKNISSFEKILQTVISGCNHVNGHVLRQCFSAIFHFVSVFAGVMPQFQPLVFSTIIPICFSVPLKPEFDLQDALYNQVLGDIVNALKSAQTKYTTEFDNFMIAQFLPQAMKLTTQEAQLVVSNLQTRSEKDFRKEFRNFLESRKRQSTTTKLFAKLPETNRSDVLCRTYF